MCDSVYLTLVGTEVECDTFIDMALFDDFHDDPAFELQVRLLLRNVVLRTHDGCRCADLRGRGA